MNQVMRATIQGESGELEVFMVEADDLKSYWWEDIDGRECEVSGRTKQEALQAACDAWSGSWQFTPEDEELVSEILNGSTHE